MSAGEQSNQMNNNNAPEGAEGGHEEDDDFGDFEGFEGGVERMQAQPAPSPWATFPDLLPVQTSPATPSDDAQASTSRMGNMPRDVWQPIASNGPWPGPGLNHDDLRPLPQQMRTLNPPDVSLGTNQAIGGRVTPDNVHNAALAVVMDHMDGVAVDVRIPVAQIDMLHQQLENAEQNRVLLEEQVEGLQQRNIELEQQVANSQAQINELQTRLQRNQETLEQQLTELRAINSADWRQDLRQIQEAVEAIKQSQIAERNQAEASRQNMEEVKAGICSRLQSVESNIQREYANMEKRLSSKFDEQCQQVKMAIEAVVQQTAQQVSGSLSQLVCEAVHNSHNCGDHQGNNLLQSIKLELEKHKEQQKRVLEGERQQQLITVSTALQSALQHLTSAINDGPKLKDGDIS